MPDRSYGGDKRPSPEPSPAPEPAVEFDALAFARKHRERLTAALDRDPALAPLADRLDVALSEPADPQAFGLASPVPTDPPGDGLRTVLAPYADDLADAAERTDDPEVRDAYLVLAALARGEDVPLRAAERVVERAEQA